MKSLLTALVLVLISIPAFAQVPFIDIAEQTCIAFAPGETPGNTYAGVYGDANTHFVVTKKGRVNANCRGPDRSGIYEEEAENDRIEMDECTIFLPDGRIAYGWGHFVAAANDACEYCGGNFSMHCHGFLAVDQ